METPLLIIISGLCLMGLGYLTDILDELKKINSKK